MSSVSNPDHDQNTIQPLLPGELDNLVGDRANQAEAASRFADYRSRRGGILQMGAGG